MASQTQPEHGEYDSSMTTIAELAVAVRAVAQHASTFTYAATQLSSSLQRRITNLEDRMDRLGMILEATLDASVSQPPEEAEMLEEAHELDVYEDEDGGGVEVVSDEDQDHVNDVVSPDRDVLAAPTELDEDSQASVVWVEETPGSMAKTRMSNLEETPGADGQHRRLGKTGRPKGHLRGLMLVEVEVVAKLLMNAPWRSED